MSWLPLLLGLAAILLVGGWRYHNVGLLHAGPFPLSPLMWWSAAGFAIALALLALRGIFRADGGQKRALLESLGIFAGLFVFVWGWLPSDSLAPIHWITVATFLALLALLFWLDRRRRSDWGLGFGGFGEALRLLAVPTAIMILVPVATLPFGEHDVRFGRVLISLVTYPLYALAQLTVFTAFLIPRLRRMGASRRARILIPSALFALIHWPNGPLMLACAVTMMAWAWVFAQRPSVPALALSMGLAATAFTQLLPGSITEHLRVGPGYVLAEHLEDMFEEQAPQWARLSSQSYYDSVGGSLDAYGTGLFVEILGREPSPSELDEWSRRESRRRRAAIVEQFFTAPEARNRGLPVPAEVEVEIESLSSEQTLDAHKGDFNAFVRSLYLSILRRDASDEAVASWSEHPDSGQRGEIVHAFYELPEYRHRAGSIAARNLRLGPPLARGHYR